MINLAVDLLESQAAQGEDDEPQERPTLLSWSTARRVIQDRHTREYALFSLDDYPWMPDIYNLIDDLIQNAVANKRAGVRCIIRKPAQVALTEMVINLTFFTIDLLGVRVFYALPPGLGVLGDFAHDRLDPAIENSPYIQAMAGDISNAGFKRFRHGAIYLRSTYIIGADPRSAPSLASVPADVLIVDEFDRIPPGAIPLMRDRLGDSPYQVEIDLSTPTYPEVGIDIEYQESTQHEPQIQCSACETWHWLEWSMVGEKAGRLGVWCPACGQDMRRLTMWADGRARYEPRHPGRGNVGIGFSRLVSPRADLGELWEQFKAANTEAKLLAFYNNALGLPYEPKGARVSLSLLRAAAEPGYRMPDTAPWCAMGVDVGIDLHVWIAEPVGSGDAVNHRAVFVGAVSEWADLDALMVRYGVGCCVVDDAPELKGDIAFANRFRGKVFLATYVEDMPGAQWVDFDLKTQRVRIDRSAGLDRSHTDIEAQIDILPENFEMIDDLVAHLTVNLKQKVVRADGVTVYRFPQSGKPDHLDHARVYMKAAMERVLMLRPPGRQSRSAPRPKAGNERLHKGVGGPPTGL